MGEWQIQICWLAENLPALAWKDGPYAQFRFLRTRPSFRRKEEPFDKAQGKEGEAETQLSLVHGKDRRHSTGVFLGVKTKKREEG